MSIEVIYQGLTIAKGPSFRLQDGGVFVEAKQVAATSVLLLIPWSRCRPVENFIGARLSAAWSRPSVPPV